MKPELFLAMSIILCLSYWTWRIQHDFNQIEKKRNLRLTTEKTKNNPTPQAPPPMGGAGEEDEMETGDTDPHAQDEIDRWNEEIPRSSATPDKDKWFPSTMTDLALREAEENVRVVNNKFDEMVENPPLPTRHTMGNKTGNKAGFPLRSGGG